MQRLGPIGGSRRLALSRETLLDLAPGDEHTEAVRGGTVQDPTVVSWCRPCGPIDPERTTGPPTGEDCMPPAVGDRYKVTDNSQTEYTYSVVEVSETDDTISYVIDEMSVKRLESSVEKVEPDENPDEPIA